MAAQGESQKNWASVRTILEGLILAVLCYSAKSQADQATAIAVVQADVSAVRAQLADVPGLRDRVTRLEAQVEGIRRDRNSQITGGDL